MQGNKYLLVSYFYMLHRRMNDVQELRKSLELATINQNRQIVVTVFSIALTLTGGT
ncbi:hypothetical protein DPMN_165531 [Dreissena polymorpha]|uniref:Uncharacterized protein n=1 Tax=Dreissena polymorpha TaxID=45954 RepID=A0A9D4EW97_DREPO|nr:hypothetical protein DPMN_165531 [Dreissena polymorpha]